MHDQDDTGYQGATVIAALLLGVIVVSGSLIFALLLDVSLFAIWGL
jgi:hypothetical protein